MMIQKKISTNIWMVGRIKKIDGWLYGYKKYIKKYI